MGPVLRMEPIGGMGGAALGQNAGGAAGLGMHGVEQIATVDAEIVELVRIEGQEIIERLPLSSHGTGFAVPSGDHTERIQCDGGDRRPLAREQKRHFSLQINGLPAGEPAARRAMSIACVP